MQLDSDHSDCMPKSQEYFLKVNNIIQLFSLQNYQVIILLKQHSNCTVANNFTIIFRQYFKSKAYIKNPIKWLSTSSVHFIVKSHKIFHNHFRNNIDKNPLILNFIFYICVEIYPTFMYIFCCKNLKIQSIHR